MAETKLDLRQSVYRPTPTMVGSTPNTGADTVVSNVDIELQKLFGDRNVLLTDGGDITFTGSQLQFTENLHLSINSTAAGGPPVVINLGSTTLNLGNGDMWYAIINRVAGTATSIVTTSISGLPPVNLANLEVWLLAKREDSADGTLRVYFRDGFALSAGETARIGGGGGTGFDVDTILTSLAGEVLVNLAGNVLVR